MRDLIEEIRDIWKYLRKLYMFLFGEKLFAFGILFGLVLTVSGITGYKLSLFELSDCWERVFGTLIGFALILGFGGSLVICRSKKLNDQVRYRLRLTVRIDSMLVGPLIACLNSHDLVKSGGIWLCILLYCATVIPFGVSLAVLIFEKRGVHP